MPLDRQKLMSKAWKGVLKDDMALGDVQGGTVITLMGSADAVTRPVEKAVRHRTLASAFAQRPRESAARNTRITHPM